MDDARLYSIESRAESIIDSTHDGHVAELAVLIQELIAVLRTRRD